MSEELIKAENSMRSQETIENSYGGKISLKQVEGQVKGCM